MTKVGRLYQGGGAAGVWDVHICPGLHQQVAHMLHVTPVRSNIQSCDTFGVLIVDVALVFPAQDDVKGPNVVVVTRRIIVFNPKKSYLVRNDKKKGTETEDTHFSELDLMARMSAVLFSLSTVPAKQGELG